MTKKHYANMRAAKERKRLEGHAPDYPIELPVRRRKIEITDYDFGERKVLFEMYRCGRRDCYKLIIDGKIIKKRIGFSNILVILRKMFPPLARV